MQISRGGARILSSSRHTGIIDRLIYTASKSDNATFTFQKAFSQARLGALLRTLFPDSSILIICFIYLLANLFYLH